VHAVNIALTILGLVAIFAALVPLVRRQAWWIRIFDFPRIQIAALALVVLIGDLAWRSDSGVFVAVFRILLTACILYQAYMIYPYTFLVPKQVRPSKASRERSRFSLFIANVKIENRNAAGLRKIISDNNPDVILILEADDWWRGALVELERSHRFTVQKPLDNSYGMLFYTRLELLNAEILFRVYDDVPSVRARIALPSGVEVELYCLHPKPPVPREEGSSEQRDAELLIVGRETRGNSTPTVVMGDLNDVAWSHTNYLFQRVSGLLDPRIGRGFYNTFDARYPIMRFPLDHFFHSNHFRLITLRRLPYFGSDHFPMYIALSYEPEAAREQKAESPSSEDEREANEKIQRAPAGGGGAKGVESRTSTR
jgi:endonuclease/exonuclease/phosphatase (EEP) superfamily protein YafD